MHGLPAEAWPLFEVVARPWSCPDPSGFDGLLIGSANALRHAGPQLDELGDLPVHAVGEATAAAARSRGLRVASTGTGDLAQLLRSLPPPLRLLRLCGEEHVPAAPPAGVTLASRVVYRVRPLPIGEPLARRLRAGALVLLHSAAAARHFAGEYDRLKLPRGAIALACLAPRVAASAGGGWARIASADRPAEGALLALAGQLCQSAELGSRDGRDAHGG